MYLVDYLHQHGMAVILDWVPSHFPSDGHGLASFDGTHLFEHSDSRQGFHPDWKTFIFNYGRSEVRSFLMSSAMFWLDKYHIDGLRVDAVASMLYLDYSRKQGEWIPNQFGGRENLEAIDFLRRFNLEAYKEHPDIQTFAEESTSYPMVSRPTYLGGLGFGLKWDMGWMHDTLEYFSQRSDPSPVSPQQAHVPHAVFVPRKLRAAVEPRRGGARKRLADRQNAGRRVAEIRQPAAALRLHVRAAGQEIAVHGLRVRPGGSEWSHDRSLDWNVLEYPSHRGLMNWVEQLNRLYRSESPLHWFDNDPRGFEWVDCNDAPASIVVAAAQRQGR